MSMGTVYYLTGSGEEFELINLNHRKNYDDN